MIRSRRRTAPWLLPIVLAAALGLSACGGGAADAGAKPQSITIAIEQNVDNMDGLVSNSAPVNQIIGAALVKVGTDGSAAPDLAASWTPSADAKTWTFTLKPNLKFSDGTPLTADDVVFSYDTVLKNKKSKQNVYVTTLASVAAQGADKVLFTLTAANATWPRIATNIPVAPKAEYDAATYNTKPVGAGPYSVDSFNGTDTVKVVANPNYYAGAPAIPAATIQYVPDETTRLNGLQSGQFDAAVLSGNNVDVAKSAGLAAQSVTGSKVIYMGYDSGTGVMANEKLRQAVSFAIDRNALVKSILQGYGEPVDQMISSTTFGYDKNATVPAQDVAEAKQLVAESGYTGEEIPLRYPTGYVPSPADMSQAVANYLTQIGLKVKLEPQDASAFLNDWLAKKLGPMWLFSAQTVTLEGAGTFKYVDVALNTAPDQTLPNLYNQMVAQSDDTQRLATMAEMNKIRTDKAYYTPLFVQNFVYVHSTKFALPNPPANGYMNPVLFAAS